MLRDYPKKIHIETTGRCNSHCSCCPHYRSPRRYSLMAPELFEKIIREAEEIPGIFVISPFKLGEPLLDPLFSKRLLQINSQLPNAYVEIHTNLNYLPIDFIPTLLQMQRITNIWISLNHYTRNSYYDDTGMSLDLTVQNILKLISAKIPHKLTIGRVASYTEEDNKWSEWATQMFPNTPVKGLHRGNWCSNVENIRDTKHFGPCSRTKELSICCDGMVALCCMDGLCEYPLGNVITDNIIDVFNGPKAKTMRAMTERTNEPCLSCSFDV